MNTPLSRQLRCCVLLIGCCFLAPAPAATQKSSSHQIHETSPGGSGDNDVRHTLAVLGLRSRVVRHGLAGDDRGGRHVHVARVRSESDLGWTAVSECVKIQFLRGFFERGIEGKAVKKALEKSIW